ncbi:MAG TPA: chemotaxis protein CheA [Bryobacteraceae bacterium]|nr:chemotaxis protein CheA [Bryobacteraceae bacterium]
MRQTNPVNTFLQEAEDLLEQIEEIALGLEECPDDAEAVNRLFRAFHTIKGSGAMFGFDAVAGFTHHLETLLDRVREGRLAWGRELTELTLAARDHIKALLAAPDRGIGESEVGRNIVAATQALLNIVPDAAAAPSAARREPGGGDPAESRPPANWRIRFHPNPDLMVNGTNPAWLLDELRALGSATVTGHAEAIPSLDAIQPDRCYLWWEIALATSAGLDAIRDVFIFVEDGSRIEIEEAAAAGQPADAPQAAVAGQPEDAAAPAAVAAPRKTAPGAQRADEPSRQGQAADATVRVPSEKLDRLVNLVGELVMNQSRLTQAAARMASAELASPVEEIERLVAELRDNVLGIRMMPIGRTFNRFKRLVHDLSTELSKEIDLVTEGAETELDKTVLDQLGDPLVHLIRNSIDHGIEPPAERERNGKPRRGSIRLSAVHAGSNVVVSIADDGRGLDPAAIRAHAIEKQIVAADAVLSNREIFNLIFLPGFSTARQVTAVSGRGVGMDVVRRQVEALRGAVAVASEPGRGATISLTLPLTLAIIDGLLVEVERDQFILPMSSVTENVELHAAERRTKNGRNVIAVRGELVPYIDLREVFAMRGERPEIERIVIVHYEDTRVGLVVDHVVGTHQTVIQSLGRFYSQIEVVSGATIMGDGRVALILDPARLIHFADARSDQPAPVWEAVSA